MSEPTSYQVQREVLAALNAADGKSLTADEILPRCPTAEDVLAIRRVLYQMAKDGLIGAGPRRAPGEFGGMTGRGAKGLKTYQAIADAIILPPSPRKAPPPAAKPAARAQTATPTPTPEPVAAPTLPLVEGDSPEAFDTIIPALAQPAPIPAADDPVLTAIRTLPASAWPDAKVQAARLRELAGRLHAVGEAVQCWLLELANRIEGQCA